MRWSVFLLAILAIILSACGTPDLPDKTAFIDTGVDPNAWVSIPAGSFLEGQHDHQVTIENAYEIMVTPVTNSQFSLFLNQALANGKVKIINDQALGNYPGDTFHGYKHEEEIPAGDKLLVPLKEPGIQIASDGIVFNSLPGYDNHPMIMITWFGAKAYCEYMKGRLATELEWEKAARGNQDNRAYPWGDTLESNQANYSGSKGLLASVLGHQGDTTPVGFYSGKIYNNYQTKLATSPYGLYDMAGNVWQWTGNIFEGTHYRYMRGGSKADYGYNLRVWSRNNARPDYFSSNVGFRCVRDIQQ